MTTTRREQPKQPMDSTGAHRARSRVPRPTLVQAPPTRYEPYLDGLFTYCLSVLCDHGEATAVLGEVLAISERRHGRCPSGEPERKAWLYALARWACLHKLAEQRRRRQGAHSGSRAPVPDPVSPVPEETAAHHRAELALLAWPEAAGTTPEQRDALELAVRHGLGPRQVAAVLGMDHPSARELLAAAACEVERTRAALAVVEGGTCPIVARLTGDSQVLLGTALRRELVRHVDDCPRCRRSAERAGAGGPWPGTGMVPAALPVVPAPRSATYAAMLAVPKVRVAAPRFDRDGFPLDPKDRAARRDRLRTRAVTTTVVATVVAAPVFALWAAYRGAPLTGESQGGASVTASEADEAGSDNRNDRASGDDSYDAYENAGNARPTPDSDFTPGTRSPDVSVQVISGGTPGPGRPGGAAGRLTVEARSAGSTTVVTLTASGSSPVSWSAWTDASWLYLSQSSGTLAPGESITLYVSVDHEREPSGAWRARIGIGPSGAMIAVEGRGRGTTNPRPVPPNPPPRPDPTPTHPTDPTTPPPDPDPTPTDPTTPPPDPDPTPTPTDPPPPSDPPPSDPPPSDSPPPSD